MPIPSTISSIVRYFLLGSDIKPSDWISKVLAYYLSLMCSLSSAEQT